jgi:hypothetical protein
VYRAIGQHVELARAGAFVAAQLQADAVDADGDVGELDRSGCRRQSVRSLSAEQKGPHVPERFVGSRIDDREIDLARFALRERTDGGAQQQGERKQRRDCAS